MLTVWRRSTEMRTVPRAKNPGKKAVAAAEAPTEAKRGAQEAPAIFVHGRIANVREIASQGMYRCGVEFVR